MGGRFLPVGLNIKNETTVALIRDLAARTGLTQTAAIEDAVRNRLAELDRSGHGAAGAADARRATIERLLGALHQSVTDEERAAVHTAEIDLYDQSGLPR